MAEPHPPTDASPATRAPAADGVAAPTFPRRRATTPPMGSKHTPPWKQRVRRWLALGGLMGVDATLIIVGMLLAYWMRYNARWPNAFSPVVREVLVQNFVSRTQFLPFGVLLLALLLLLFASKGLYRLPRNAGVLDNAGIIVNSTTTAIAISIVVVFLYRSSVFYSRLIFAFAWLTIITLLCLWRFVLVEWRRWRWINGDDRERVLVVGGTGLGRGVMGSIVAQPILGYELVGYLDDHQPSKDERNDGHFRYLGVINELSVLTKLLKIDQVVLALPFWESNRLPELVNACREAGVEFRIAPDLYELSFDQVDVHNLGGVPLIGIKELSIRGTNLLIKRALDILCVLLALPVLLPVFLVVALAIRLDSRGSPLFLQQRVGKGGQPFMVYKFRTMVVDAEARKAALAALNEADGPIFKMRNDPRITRVGRFLRHTSLDELPNLWNVLRGEMSLVGPRPPTPDEVAQYNEWHMRRLEVTPGLTGLWQVLGRSDTSFDDMVRLDIYYAENWTPALDVRIILQTIPVVLSGKGAY